MPLVVPWHATASQENLRSEPDMCRFVDTAHVSSPGGTAIVVNGTSSFVNATVKITDSKGKKVCSTPGVQIDYRRNQLTTIKGKFLTSGVNNGGIRIDTEWDGEYEVWF